MQQQPIRVSEPIKVLWYISWLCMGIWFFYQFLWVPLLAQEWHEFMVEFDHWRC